MRELIRRIVPPALHDRIRGIEADDIAAFCAEYELVLHEDHAEFLTFAGATDQEVFSEIYDFRPGGLGSSPFVPVYRWFLCVGYNSYPDSASLYVDAGPSPRAGVYGLLDEQLSGISRDDILASTPDYTCFASAFGEALFKHHLIDRTKPTHDLVRRGRDDLRQVSALALQLGMTPLLERADVAIFERSGVFALCSVHSRARHLSCRFAGADHREVGRAYQVFEDNLP